MRTKETEVLRKKKLNLIIKDFKIREIQDETGEVENTTVIQISFEGIRFHRCGGHSGLSSGGGCCAGRAAAHCQPRIPQGEPQRPGAVHDRWRSGADRVAGHEPLSGEGLWWGAGPGQPGRGWADGDVEPLGGDGGGAAFALHSLQPPGQAGG